MLRWKNRFLIILITISIFIMSLLINQILIESPSKLNERNPLFFDSNNYYSSFYFNNGSYNYEQIVIIQSININTTTSNITITIGQNLQGYFLAHPNGIVYQNKILKGNFSFWWILVPNLLTTFGQGLEPGKRYDIIDPTGFLGVLNAEYILIIERKGVYWPYDQRLGNLLGAQASFDVSIYNESNMVKIATATYDQTTGNIELLEGGVNIDISLSLFQTNFPISRNRINQMWIALIYGPIIIIVAYLFMRIDWQVKYLRRLHLKSEMRNETSVLLIAGWVAIIIEMVDIWFYLPIGFMGNILIHVVFTAFLGILCIIYRYKLAWLIPSILEIMFILAIVIIEGEPYVPHLTAFMGSTISWLCMVIASGLPNKLEGKTWLGKILSKFI
ncbi:MAG: hypothetical protein ACTSPY_17075 [Candidatus Helarchaeota archaeon]